MASPSDIAEEILKLKLNKSKVKTKFTKSKNKLLNLIDAELIDKQSVKELGYLFDAVLDEVISVMEELCHVYMDKKEYENAQKVTDEIEQVSKEYSETTQEVYVKLQAMKSTSSVSSVAAEPEDLTKDLWRQMKRVGIPVFYGDKRKYESWKAAFTACIEKAPATPEYKLLQLRQYLKGEALHAIEDLGHSSEAYEAAKERLDRKFGGERRKLMRFFDDIEKFPSLKSENPNEVEKLADLVDIAVINLKEANREEDLGCGTLYLELQRKLPEKMLSRFHRWLFETKEEESVETLRMWLNQESKYLLIAYETKYGFANNEKSNYKEKKGVNRTYFGKNSQVKECLVCNSKQHDKIWECDVFKAKDNKDRWQTAKDLGLCFRCLRKNHQGKNCNNFRVCGVQKCIKNHHSLLHNQRELNSNAQEFVPQSSQNDTRNEQQVFYTLNNKVQTFETMTVNLSIESLNGQLHTEVEAMVLDNITGSLETVNWNEHTDKWQHLKGINFPVLSKNKKVDMLIGLDYAMLHSSLHEIHGNPGEPIARLTPLSWTCVGQFNDNGQTSLFSTYFISQPDDLDQMLKGFWEIESYGSQLKDTSLTPIEERVYKDSLDTMTFSEGHFSVKIPWKKDPSDLPNNYEMAVKRLEQVKKKLKKDSQIETAYNETIESYLQKGYLRRVPKDENDPMNKWYLPHFPVVHLERETTKVRLVFDAAAKYNCVCLNDYIHTGPKLQNELFDVLLRFRKNDVAIMCDISEMYLRVGIHETDRRFHRFLWDGEEYEFNTLVFGINASPFLAQLVAQTNARMNEQKYPLAAETIQKSTYMDDSMDSMQTDEQALELYEQLCEVWLKAGMYPRKWVSNSRTVLEKIPQKERAKEVNLDTSYLPTTKALGVIWQAQDDFLTFKINEKSSTISTVTKRNLLKRVASLFDPLGFLSPYILRGKILLQQFWLGKYDWDDRVESDLANRSMQWLEELLILNNVTVPRSLSFYNIKKPIIHIFSDASEEAYGTVAYLRTDDGEEISVKFICSKTKVSPLVSVSIPRLELMAAVLGLRVAITVTKAITMCMSDVVFWSDSSNVLHWISNESRRFKPFVANRLGEIHEHSSPKQWRYIPGAKNPADLASRGTTAENLVQNTLWWEGPDFLHKQEKYWPKKITEKPEFKLTELKKRSKSEAYFVNIETTEDRLNPDRFSDWLHLLRVTAWVKRFVNNCQTRTERNKNRTLTIDEIEKAEIWIIHNTQVKNFPDEYRCLVKGKQLSGNSKLMSLNVKLDEERLMRCDTRLVHAEFLPYNARFPVVLPRKSPVTRLLVKKFHENGYHCGTNQTLAAMSSKYWLIGGREEIRAWEKECRRCKRLKAQASRQIMAPLPPIRLKKPMRAFAYCSVDYAGPFFTKQGRGKARQKRYLCLFTCLSTRAVHLEISFGLDTDSFLNAFYRMASRRGFPEEIYSDNGTNFVGAHRELLDLYNKMDKQKIIDKGSNHKIKWYFNPPLAPHFGGVHESMVKSAKKAIYIVLKEADVSDEELLTAITGAEGLINSRPISYQTANSYDDTVLTPNHFIHGQLGGQFAPEAVDTTVFNIKKRWRYVQEIVKHFWHRWLKEFIPTLSNRKKWYREERDLKVDDIVLVINNEKPRGEWSIGKIITVYPGSDKHVRVVDVRIGKSILRRPITRLCLIEKAE